MDTTITIEFFSDTEEHLKSLEHQLKHIHDVGVDLVEPQDVVASPIVDYIQSVMLLNTLNRFSSWGIINSGRGYFEVHSNTAVSITWFAIEIATRNQRL